MRRDLRRAGVVRLLNGPIIPATGTRRRTCACRSGRSSPAHPCIQDRRRERRGRDCWLPCSRKAEAARQLAYRLYTLCERAGWAEDARAYNELITSWSCHRSRRRESARVRDKRNLFDV